MVRRAIVIEELKPGRLGPTLRKQSHLHLIRQLEIALQRSLFERLFEQFGILDRQRGLRSDRPK